MIDSARGSFCMMLLYFPINAGIYETFFLTIVSRSYMNAPRFNHYDIAMATMKVILATKLEGLGCEADLVTVKAGYGRNYLIPQGLAFEATPSNRRFINMLKKKRAEREAAELANFREVAEKLLGEVVRITLEAGKGGKIFGAVTNQMISDALAAKGIDVNRHALELEKPIKQAGTYEITAKLHPEVSAAVKVIVTVSGAVQEEPATESAPVSETSSAE